MQNIAHRIQKRNAGSFLERDEQHVPPVGGGFRSTIPEPNGERKKVDDQSMYLECPHEESAEMIEHFREEIPEYPDVRRVVGYKEAKRDSCAHCIPQELCPLT